MDPSYYSRQLYFQHSLHVASVHPVSVLVPEHPGEGGGGGGPRVQAGQAEVGGQQLRLAQQRGTPRCQTSAAGKHAGINIVWEELFLCSLYCSMAHFYSNLEEGGLNGIWVLMIAQFVILILKTS